MYENVRYVTKSQRHFYGLCVLTPRTLCYNTEQQILYISRTITSQVAPVDLDCPALLYFGRLVKDRSSSRTSIWSTWICHQLVCISKLSGLLVTVTCVVSCWSIVPLVTSTLWLTYFVRCLASCSTVGIALLLTLVSWQSKLAASYRYRRAGNILKLAGGRDFP